MTSNTHPRPPIVATLAPSRLPPTAATCGEDDIVTLVHGFYAKVREDAMLGPIFERHVNDWDAHLALLVDFRSALLRGTRRFKGSPVTRHLALPGLEASLFRH